jgi:molybdate transport system permease protein
MNSEGWQIIWFTCRVAALSTVLILPFGIGLAWLLARRSWPGKSLVETVVLLPLVMPPVACGLLLLQLLSRHGALGGWLQQHLGWQIVFTWRAVLAALAVMSFPLLVRSARQAFEEVDPRLEKVAGTLGAGPWRVFFTITLPLAWRGVLGGAVLAFARALGEFGATITVAGNIPGQTTTISLAIYQAIQLGDDVQAWRLLAASVLLAFCVVWIGNWLMSQKARRT